MTGTITINAIVRSAENRCAPTSVLQCGITSAMTGGEGQLQPLWERHPTTCMTSVSPRAVTGRPMSRVTPRHVVSSPLWLRPVTCRGVAKRTSIWRRGTAVAGETLLNVTHADNSGTHSATSALMRSHRERARLT